MGQGFLDNELEELTMLTPNVINKSYIGRNDKGLRVTIYPEHKRLIDLAGYTFTTNCTNDLIANQPITVLLKYSLARGLRIEKVQGASCETWLSISDTAPNRIKETTL